jgi:hypothetical protein
MLPIKRATTCVVSPQTLSFIPQKLEVHKKILMDFASLSCLFVVIEEEHGMVFMLFPMLTNKFCFVGCTHFIQYIFRVYMKFFKKKLFKLVYS